MIDREQLKKEVLQECAEDHVGLWAIIWPIRYALNGGRYPPQEEDKADPLEIRRIALEAARELLEAGLIQAGFPTPDGRGFKPWPLSPDEVIARINADWDALGREPNIGDVVWFTATKKGEQEVNALAANKK